jgi:hypothetical protein
LPSSGSVEPRRQAADRSRKQFYSLFSGRDNQLIVNRYSCGMLRLVLQLDQSLFDLLGRAAVVGEFFLEPSGIQESTSHFTLTRWRRFDVNLEGSVVLPLNV